MVVASIHDNCNAKGLGIQIPAPTVLRGQNCHWSSAMEKCAMCPRRSGWQNFFSKPGGASSCRIRKPDVLWVIIFLNDKLTAIYGEMRASLFVKRLDVVLLTLHANVCFVSECAPPPVGAMTGESDSPNGSPNAPPPGDNQASVCRTRTCQGGLITVDPHSLAVLHPGFERGLMAAWRETTILTDNGVSDILKVCNQSQVYGVLIEIASCNF